MAKSLRSKSKRKFRAIRREKIFNPHAEARLGRVLTHIDGQVEGVQPVDAVHDQQVPAPPKFSFASMVLGNTIHKKEDTKIQTKDTDMTSLDISIDADEKQAMDVTMDEASTKKEQKVKVVDRYSLKKYQRGLRSKRRNLKFHGKTRNKF